MPYCASKGGVELLTKALALDWAKRGVRVNTLAPGWVDTDLTHGLLEHDVHGKRLLDRTPLGRFAPPLDMAGGVVFLASDASAFMTGGSLRDRRRLGRGVARPLRQRTLRMALPE